MRAERVKRYAKYMRENPTLAEYEFWNRVKKRQFLRLRFNRQKIFNYIEHDGIMRFYIVDFYCHALKLIVEIDGEYHENPEQIELDQFRTETLEILGLHLIRFNNNDVLHHWDKVESILIDKIKYLDDQNK